MAKSPKFPRRVGNKSKCMVVRPQPTSLIGSFLFVMI